MNVGAAKMPHAGREGAVHSQDWNLIYRMRCIEECSISAHGDHEIEIFRCGNLGARVRLEIYVSALQRFVYGVRGDLVFVVRLDVSLLQCLVVTKDSRHVRGVFRSQELTVKRSFLNNEYALHDETSRILRVAVRLANDVSTRMGAVQAAFSFKGVVFVYAAIGTVQGFGVSEG